MSSNAKKTLAFELVILFAVFALVNLASYHYQSPGTFNEGKGTDGVFYDQVARQFASGQSPESDAPFVYRVGTPYLVSLFFGQRIYLGFKLINLLLNFFTVVFLWYWLKLFLGSSWIRALLVILFITQWHGPIRWIYLYPVSTDPSSLMFLLLGLIGMYKVREDPSWQKVLLLGGVSLLGMLFREIIFLIPLAAIFTNNPIKFSNLRNLAGRLLWTKIFEFPSLRLFLPLGFGLLGLLIPHYLATQTGDYSFLQRAQFWFSRKSLFTYIHAWFVTFGPVIVLVLFNWRRSLSFLRRHQYLLVYLLIISVLAWIGGSGTERFLNWLMPVIFLLVGQAIETHWRALSSSPVLAGLLVVSQLIAQRPFWVLTDLNAPFKSPFPVLTILSNQYRVVDLFPSYGDPHIQLISLVEYLLLTIFLLGYMNYSVRQRGLSREIE
jgi:hypothetical protein